MNRELLLDVIARTDLDLKIRQHGDDIDTETRQELAVARQLLGELRRGVIGGEQTILLPDSWSLSTLHLVLPAIGALEMLGVAVMYPSAERGTVAPVQVGG